MGLMSPAYTTTNYRKPKVKITKAKRKELELRWREHNKKMKQNHMHHMRYETLEEYIAYCYGLNKKPNPRDYKNFKPRTTQRNYAAERDAEHRKKYPSMMEEAIKNGTFNTSSDGKGTAKETQKYTGDLIVGIATMHKSNAVPVMRGTKQAEDIAKMRR